jgi:hypothetical protein
VGQRTGTHVHGGPEFREPSFACDRPDHLPTDLNGFTAYTTKNMIFGCVRKLGIRYTTKIIEKKNKRVVLIMKILCK